MTDWSAALVSLDLQDEDWGSNYRGTYEELAAGWRGSSSLPDESTLTAAANTAALATAKTNRKSQVDSLLATKIASGHTFNSVTFDLDMGTVGGIEARVNNSKRSDDNTRNITAVTRTNPVVITSPGSQAKDDDEVYISGITVGCTELNDKVYTIQRTGNLLSLYDEEGNPVDGTGFSLDWVSGGTVSLGFKWYAGNGAWAEMPLSDAENLSDEILKRQRFLNGAAGNRKIAIDALTTVSEVNSYDIESGW